MNNYSSHNNYNNRSYQENKSQQPTFDANTEWGKVKNDFASYAENVITKLEKDRNGTPKLKTNQIRNILALISVICDKKFEDIQNNLKMIKVKIAYAIGRDKKDGKLGTEDFNNKSHIYEFISLIKSQEDFKLYCNYMEALVSYHKYYGGGN
jgi:CRISPR-associated protein Csm2